jgi:uncharacterized membrane protein (DUF106 family)
MRMLKDVAPLTMAKPLSFLSRAAIQGTNYTTVAGWLLHRAFKGHVLTFVRALVYSIPNLGGQAAGIYAIYWYAKKMEANDMISVPRLGIDFAARSEPGLLWAVVIFSTLCFIGGAAFLFLSRRLILTLVENRFAKSLEELVYLTGRLPDPRAPTASRLFMNYSLSDLVGGCRCGSFTTIMFSNAITSALGGAAAALLLFRLDAPLTLLILVAAALGALLLYPLTLRAVRFAKDREKVQVAYRNEARRIQQSTARAPVEMKSAAGLAKAQMGMLRVNAELIFATQIGMTVILAVVIFYLASQMMAGQQNWAILIAYVGALRITLNACSQAVRAYASVSRYYPQIIRYFLFVKDTQHLDAIGLAKVEPGETLILGTLVNGGDVSVKAGERLALATTDSVLLVRFALLHAHAPHSAAPLGSAWLDPVNPAPGDVAVILVNADQLAKRTEHERRALDELFAGKVTLIVHRNAARVGAFGEERLLVAEDGEFRRLVTLGTPDSDAVLQEFSHQAGMRQQKELLEEQPPDEDEDDL